MLMDIFQTILSKHPTLALSHWVQKSVLYVCVSFAALMYLDFYVFHLNLKDPFFMRMSL